MALSPVVFIGIGGSGGKTLRVIHQELTSALISIKWQDDWPEAWQFLHIDVPSAPDGIEPGLPFTLPLTDFLPLTTTQSTYRSVDRQVANTNQEGFEHHLALDSWRPFPPEEVPVTISLGAGQFRAIGRVALLNNLQEVGARVNQVLEAAKSADGLALQKVQSLSGKEDLGTEALDRKPMVFIVSSISGGSGSGALLDVCDVVQSFRADETTNVAAVVYAPEVFEDSEGRLEPGIAPNTFMALNELINASWVRSVDDLPFSRKVHFTRSAINPYGDRTGPDSVFLVGRRNDRVVLGGTSEIYRVVGRSLAELALNETQQDSLAAYSRGNEASRASIIKHSVPLAPRNRDVFNITYTNLYALGFARLSLGRDIFREYAAQRLARDAALRLRDGHRARRQPGDTRKDETLAMELAESRWPAFLRDSRLNEVGYVENAVINALLPEEGLEPLIARWCREAQSKIDSESGNSRLPIKEARQQLLDEIDNAQKPDGIHPTYMSGLTERAIEWRRGTAVDPEKNIHNWLAELVLAEVASSGLQVTQLLVDRLVAEVATAVKGLKEEKQQRHEDGTLLLRALPDPKPNESAKVETEAGGEFDTNVILTEGYNALYQLFYAEAVGLAAKLLEEAIPNLLKPIARGLKHAAELLAGEIKPASRKASDFDLWPGETGIPEHLIPSAVEITLDDVEGFPGVFDELVKESLEADTVRQGRDQAVEEVIRGLGLAPNPSNTPPFEYRARWVPDHEELRRLDERTSAASLDLRIGLNDLLERARSWVLDTEKQIGKFIDQSMAEYLVDTDVGPAVLSDRRMRLTNGFKNLLQYAKPLVNVDVDGLQLAHGIDRLDYELVMTPLNIPAGDSKLLLELQEIAQGVLGHATTIPVGPQRWGTQVMTSLKQPLHPVAFKSIMEPVFTQWESDHLGQSFWAYRRARPLLEWTPMSPAAQRDIAEGWITARLLGYAHVVQDPQDFVSRIRVWSGTPGVAGSWEWLPNTGPRAITPDDALGNVLELVATSSLEVYRSKSLKPLQPFQTLLELGAAPWDKHRLHQWIKTGNGIEDSGSPILAAQENAQLRLAVANAGLDSMEIAYRAHEEMPRSSGESVGALQRLPRIEVARLALNAVRALREKLSSEGVMNHGGQV